MVVLEFYLDAASIRDARDLELRSVDAAAMQETLLIMPVRLRIGAVELLESIQQRERQEWASDLEAHSLVPVDARPVPSPWWPLPLLNVATVGLRKVQELARSRVSVYHLPGGGWLRFERLDGQVRVTSDHGRTAVASADELTRAFTDFASQARDLVQRHLPQLAEHPHWGRWVVAEREQI